MSLSLNLTPCAKKQQQQWKNHFDTAKEKKNISFFCVWHMITSPGTTHTNDNVIEIPLNTVACELSRRRVCMCECLINDDHVYEFFVINQGTRSTEDLTKQYGHCFCACHGTHCRWGQNKHQNKQKSANAKNKATNTSSRTKTKPNKNWTTTTTKMKHGKTYIHMKSVP